MATFFGGLGGSEEMHKALFADNLNEAKEHYAKFTSAKSAGKPRAARAAAMDFYEAASRAREQTKGLQMSKVAIEALASRMAEVRAFIVGRGS
jgi:hypothetical protein